MRKEREREIKMNKKVEKKAGTRKTDQFNSAGEEKGREMMGCSV